MRVYIVTASINKLSNIRQFESTLMKHDCKLIIVDEGDERIRKTNDKLISGIPHKYYGPRERKEWFKERFGSDYIKYLSVIPEKCHAETSFGFLVAYEQSPDLVIEIDDDVFPFGNNDLIDDHADNLFSATGDSISSQGRWYNTTENLSLSRDNHVFPRGHPYAPEARTEKYTWNNRGGKCVLNMGLWAGNPDLDALTIIYHGGFKGKCYIESKKCIRSKVIVDQGTFFAICSMNTSFVPMIIPAFYQMYMNFLGVDRFDDIWSGIFLKKVTDHLGHMVCLGKPVVYHDRHPRNTFNDLKKELDGIIINETLWRTVDSLELDGDNYFDTYSSLIEQLEKSLDLFQDPLHRKFMKIQTSKMKNWLRVVEKLEVQ